MKIKSEKVVGFITVRSSSKRLPQKCLLPFGDGNILNHVISRALFCGIEPVICTSTDKTDDIIEKIAYEDGVKIFRGSLTNKIKRWADCASNFKLKSFHTIDADDPFFDGEEIFRSMDLLNNGNFDMVRPTKSSEAGGASVGYSISTSLVKNASSMVSEEIDTEMAWYYLEKVPGIIETTLQEKLSTPKNLRLTLDYEEDYWLLESIRRILGNFVSQAEIHNFFRKNPDFYKINFFRNSEWKALQLKKS